MTELSKLTTRNLNRYYFAICPKCGAEIEAVFPITFCELCKDGMMYLTRKLKFRKKAEQEESMNGR
jgi:hypothetical protein